MSSYITRKTPGDTAWFTHDRFGMFIHWGLYALRPATNGSKPTSGFRRKPTSGISTASTRIYSIPGSGRGRPRRRG